MPRIQYCIGLQPAAATTTANTITSSSSNSSSSSSSNYKKVALHALHYYELHVLQPLLPKKKMISNHNLRARQHDRQLIAKSLHINDSLFIVGMLYRDSY